MDEMEQTEANQYLTFMLEGDVFALEIVKVREAMYCTHITKVPRMPEYITGVINLRGNVVSVIDLRLMLGMDQIEKTIDTCIVIVEVDMDGEMILIGAMADSVQEVITLNPEQIDPPPKLGTKLNTEFIRGMGKRGEEFLIILDIERVLSSEEITTIRNMNESRPNTDSSKLSEPLELDLL